MNYFLHTCPVILIVVFLGYFIWKLPEGYKLLFVFLFCPGVLNATNVTFPTSSVFAQANSMTASGVAKSTTLAAGLAVSYAMANSSANIVGSYIPVRVSQPGTLAMLWYKLTAYNGPSTDFTGNYPLTFEQTVGSYYIFRKWGSGQMILTGGTYDMGPISGITALETDFLSGFDNTYPPARGFVTGKAYRFYDYPMHYDVCSSYTPPLVCGVSYPSEFWTSLWSGTTLNVELQTTMPPLGSKVLGDGVLDISPAFTEPVNENYIGWDVIGGSWPVTDTILPAAVADYLDSGTLSLNDGVDLSSLTMVSGSGYLESDGEEIQSSTGVIVNTSVTVNVSTGEIVDKLTEISSVTSSIYSRLISTAPLFNTYIDTAATWGQWLDFKTEFSSAPLPLLGLIIPVSTQTWVPCFDLSGFWSGYWAGSLPEGKTGTFCLTDFSGWNTFIDLLKCSFSLMILLWGIFEFWDLLKEIRVPGVSGGWKAVGYVAAAGMVAFSYFIYQYAAGVLVYAAGLYANCVGACAGLGSLTSPSELVLMMNYLGVTNVFALMLTVIQAKWNFMLFLNFWGALRQ